jgi:formate transporter
MAQDTGTPRANEVFGLDACSPREIAARVKAVGVVKARMPLPAMALLGVLSGAFIGLGGLVFSLGLLLVCRRCG